MALAPIDGRLMSWRRRRKSEKAQNGWVDKEKRKEEMKKRRILSRDLEHLHGVGRVFRAARCIADKP
jgi:hypothetical protein